MATLLILNDEINRKEAEKLLKKYRYIIVPDNVYVNTLNTVERDLSSEKDFVVVTVDFMTRYFMEHIFGDNLGKAVSTIAGFDKIKYVKSDAEIGIILSSNNTIIDKISFTDTVKGCTTNNDTESMNENSENKMVKGFCEAAIIVLSRFNPQLNDVHICLQFCQNVIREMRKS